MSQGTDSAVVVGAGMGGLLAARALSEVYRCVTVVERDPLPDDDAPRRGIPQGRHVHALLARGREALEELFPGLTDELAACGAPVVDAQAQGTWVNSGHEMCRAPSGLVVVGASRPLLESRVRARVRALPNVEVLDRRVATGLSATPDRSRVTGLRLLSGEDDGRSAHRPEEVLPADLVVDTTGRGSRGPQWLRALGHPEPEVEQLRIGLVYASRSYRRGRLDSAGAFVSGTPRNPRAGAMIAQEGDRWMVTLAGMMGDVPPLDDRGFTAFARSLPSPVIAEVVEQAAPLSDAVRIRVPVSTRRRYERSRRLPGGYLVLGDAVCSFDPIYGQGMTVAALEALALRECLGEGAADLPRRFLRRATRVVETAWELSVGADLRFPDVVGPRTPKVRAVNAYLERLHVAAEHDPVVGRAFLRVVNMVDRPEALLAPRIALRVLRGQRVAAAVRRGASATA